MWRRGLVGVTVVLSIGCLGGATSEENDTEAEDPRSAYDVLFVMDNSVSMTAEATALALALPAWLETVPGRTRIGLITTAADGTGTPGSMGTLAGNPVFAEDEDAALELTRALLCHATCWNLASIPDDATYSCDPSAPAAADPISTDYLDCLCDGEDLWLDQCGSGTEEPLEATLLRLCRDEGGVDECLDSSELTSEDLGQNDLMIEDRETLVLIISDEGDSSRRLSLGDEDPSVYLTLYKWLAPDLTIHVWGPNTESCQAGASSGVQRLVTAASATGGTYSPLFAPDESSDCELTDAGDFLAGTAPAE